MSKKPTIYLIHGFNVDDKGAGTVDRFAPYLEVEGFTVVSIDYGHTMLAGVRLCNNKLARTIANMAEPGSIIIGHSNGCSIIHRAVRFGAKFSQCVYINPALNRHATIGEYDAPFKMHVYHSPSDWVVKFARLLPFHLWGDMGAVGYKGDDRRYVSYNKQADATISSKSHSDVFDDDKFDTFARRVVRDLGFAE